jgi:hypothetical protein
VSGEIFSVQKILVVKGVFSGFDFNCCSIGVRLMSGENYIYSWGMDCFNGKLISLLLLESFSCLEADGLMNFLREVMNCLL